MVGHHANANTERSCWAYSIGPTNSGHRQSAPKFRRLHPCNRQAVRFLLPSGIGPCRGRGPYWKNPSRNGTPRPRFARASPSNDRTMSGGMLHRRMGVSGSFVRRSFRCPYRVQPQLQQWSRRWASLHSLGSYNKQYCASALHCPVQSIRILHRE